MNICATNLCFYFLKNINIVVKILISHLKKFFLLLIKFLYDRILYKIEFFNMETIIITDNKRQSTDYNA